MSFDDFQHHARLYVIGALDEDEMSAFEEARQRYGAEADAYLRDCTKLNAAFALSLRPQAPRRDSKDKLLGLIQASLGERRISMHGV